ncbi:hypothetical protein [Legionella cherrii]|uniref:Protein with a bacterial immunoglobulin-like domain protein n=1 Tax=Legionella cherrii TaxID=28084 RepID=A0A0W0S753_9GAMM|nr:hypothetical protein [Legionella cherrii]KTC79320.1 hypothetical protein Lche_1340 [Legionella cherrii]VEB37013.1 Uncharacterised protein [Legionella cherrii]
MEQLKHTFLKSTLAVALFATSSAFAAGVTSGQLVIINGLGNVDSTSGNAGSTASSISVVVSDSTGPCSTTATVAYNGTVTVKWSASNTHSSTSCTGISSVAVTPLKTSIGTVSTVVYDSVTTTTVPATTATATTFTPPTTAYANLALIVTGTGNPSAAVTASATAWGVGAASAPVFDTANGALTTVGVPGASGTYGVRAEEIMRHFAILPFLG